MNMVLEKRERIELKAEVRLEEKLEKSLGWLQMHLPWKTLEKAMEHLVGEGWQVEKWRYCWWLEGFV